MEAEARAGGFVRSLVLERRKAAGLNQTALAEKSGVSRSRIVAVEAGDCVPSMEACVRMARALAIPLEEVVRAHGLDALHGVEAGAVAAVERRLGGGKSHWDAIAEHHGLWIERARVAGKIDAEGNLALLRRYRGCRATRPRARMVFRDRVLGERAPGFAVKGSPRGLGYSLSVSIEGEWAEHRVEFHRPWIPEDGPFDFEFETALPGAYVLDREAFNRRQAAEGRTRTREWHGDFRTFVSYPYETLDLRLALPKGYGPEWLGPTAVWGNAPIDDADYHEVHARTTEAHAFEHAANEARLVLRRPAPGYTFGIRWLPATWETEKEVSL